MPRPYPNARVHLVQFPTDITAVPRLVEAGNAGLQTGAVVLVEVGATWGEVQGEKIRIDGAWIECEVLPKRKLDVGAGGVVMVKRRGA